MKKTIINFFKITFTIALLYSCNPSSIEDIEQVSETSDVLLIPAGFDFSTHQKVTINIVENAAYAKYDVYAYSDETLDDSEILDRLIFSGVPSNGVLKQTINVPTYYNKVYIRRNEGLNVSTTVKDIVNQEVNFNSSEAQSSGKSTSNKNLVNTDTDGDGIFDQDDAAPFDPQIAFEYFTPSKNGRGILAFEDSWPATGDYDFNDISLRYNVTTFLNADNLAVGFDFKYKILSNRAGNYNGLGFEMEGIAPSQIESVTEPILTLDIINLNPNGTEAGQDNAVIIVTDAIRNTRNNGFHEMTVKVKFVNPISTSDIGVAPFNPFLIKNLSVHDSIVGPAVRHREVHLPNMKRTSLGLITTDEANQNSNEDPFGTYISESGYPWALSIIEDPIIVRGTRPSRTSYFKVLKDTINISEGYKFFKNWAESGGSEYKDWYSNNRQGYRNEALLQEEKEEED
ncbi:LruC domain-containing protein [Polaribacter litorisediminis]|uniref:LruC domain-containing protein n=1 Tax=Polaribacter litorisediminis TaxID=1908341 RepID=UPI001CBBE336|nr:LruC domain-containing protein [Polaribacter litorisediminis]UAM96769.1 LruC domain-containing protein [Polaribacter litorisediminis]